MSKSHPRFSVKIAIAAASICMLVALSVVWIFQEKTIRASNSPDERFMLAVIKRNIDSFPVMPGQGSDVKCFVELRRRDDGQIILRKEVDMLQNVEQIEWDADKVWINPHCAISYDGNLIGIWQDSAACKSKMGVWRER